jgi:hypothetical protein
MTASAAVSKSIPTKLSDLVQDDRNANRGTRRGAAVIKRSLQDYGAARSIVVDRDNRIIAGNKTVQGARAAKLNKLRVIETDGSELVVVRRNDLQLDDPKARALAIADNRSSELSLEWDTDVLSSLSDEVDLSSLWTDEELRELLQQPSIESEDRPTKELFSQEQVMSEILASWPKNVTAEAVVAQVITRAMAMAQFNGLASGRSSGYYISAIFNPHRLQTNGMKSSRNFVDASNDDPKFRKRGAKYLFELKGGDVHPASFVKYSTIGWSGAGQLVFEFRPSIARDLYSQFCKKGYRILDPCHGWGGRVIGFLAADLPAAHYVGFDPSTSTAAGVNKLIAFLQKSKTTATAENFCEPFEDANLEPESFDFALTSPPYFDTEKYSDEQTQSAVRYPTFDAWIAGFYEPMIRKTLRALKRKRCFVLNVGNNVYKLSDIAKQIAEACGAKCSELQGQHIGRGGLIEDAATIQDAQEDFLLIEKGK